MIKVENLKFRYQQAPVFALDGVNFFIPQGKYVAILGHNGSGKSTLSKLLVGLYKPTEGTIAIDDIVFSKQNLKKIRNKIGMVFQNPENQFIGSTVEDDIAFGLENKLMPRIQMLEKVKYFAKKVNMLDHLRKEPTHLSGGQKQRVAIATVLAMDPKIIIFDEVTSMLDPKGKSEVLEIIKEIKSDSTKTLISVTHDMDEAILADYVLVFSKGKIIAQGDPREILADEKIIKEAKITNPFIYKISKRINDNKVKVTFDKEELIGELCKLK